jgi:hypothetical protein
MQNNRSQADGIDFLAYALKPGWHEVNGLACNFALVSMGRSWKDRADFGREVTSKSTHHSREK